MSHSLPACTPYLCGLRSNAPSRTSANISPEHIVIMRMQLIHVKRLLNELKSAALLLLVHSQPLSPNYLRGLRHQGAKPHVEQQIYQEYMIYLKSSRLQINHRAYCVNENETHAREMPSKRILLFKGCCWLRRLPHWWRLAHCWRLARRWRP